MVNKLGALRAELEGVCLSREASQALLLPSNLESGAVKEDLRMDDSILRVQELGNRLFLHLNVPDGKEAQRFFLPRFFSNLEEMRERGLSVSWLEEKIPAVDIYSSMLEGLNVYVSFKYPGFWVVTPIKVYADREPGALSLHTYEFSPVTTFLAEIRSEARAQSRKFPDEVWTGGYSGVLYISPEPGAVAARGEGILPVFPYEEFPYRLVVLSGDLEVLCSNDPQKDLQEVIPRLKEGGFSGWVIRSGEPGKGSYHYFSDSLLPYAPFFWQGMGRLMEVLTPENVGSECIREFARQLITARDLSSARLIGAEILDTFSSGQKFESFLDPRWVAHQLESGINILRSLEAKKYSEPPVVVAEIK